jgi:hypothetical protein
MQQKGIVSKSLGKVADKILQLSERVEGLKGDRPEKATIAVYFIGHILMCFVHEPWFDEMLAWLIARDSTFYEIVFVAPHYEGHPSLWHLILSPFAKIGMPSNISLSIVSLCFSGIAISIIVYRAPFKRIIRMLIPFTYFMFYQYGIISRPYSMMMLAFMLMAVTYKERDAKPGRFVFSIWFLCVTSAYGIVIAGGICVTWLIEMLKISIKKSHEKNSDNGEYRGSFRIFLEDHLLCKGKIFWFFGLLLYVIFILIRIIPAENAYASVRATVVSDENGLLIRLLYTLFGVLSDLVVTNTYSNSGTLRNVYISTYELTVSVFIGIALFATILFYAYKKGKIIEFVLPYTMFSAFSALVYLYDHHIGIVLLFIIYYFWACENSSKSNSIDSVNAKIRHWGLSKRVIGVTTAIMLIIPMYWNITSCVCDIFHTYGYGKKEYEFITDNQLSNYKVLAEWNKIFEGDEGHELYSDDNVAFSLELVGVSAYSLKNNILNSVENVGLTYSTIHTVPLKEEGEKQKKIICGLGKPDILLGQVSLESIYGLDTTLLEYIPVYKGTYGNIKKGVPELHTSYIYIKKEIAEIKGLQAIG